MADNTHIQWADATVNFWQGCKKVSQGCKFCYMFRDKARYNQDGSKVVRSANATFFKALKWQEPRLIFTCSWSDFFIKEADPWRAEAWDVIKKTPQHTWLILTKRPERIKQCLPPDWGNGYPNVWLGVSVENEKTAYFRILQLFEVRAKIRFLSIEPLISKINVAPFLSVELPNKTMVHPIHWVIVGGESGNETGDYRYRPCSIEWINDIVGKCKQHQVPVFIKQLGTSLARELKMSDKAGADFSDPNFPDGLKVREFPNVTTQKTKTNGKT